MNIKYSNIVLIVISSLLVSCQSTQISDPTIEIPANTATSTITPTPIPSTNTPIPSPTPFPRVIPFTWITSSIGTYPTFVNNSGKYLYLNGVYHDNIENTIIGMPSGKSIKLPGMAPGAVSFFRDTDKNIIFAYVTSEEQYQQIVVTKDAVTLALENPIQSLPELKSLWSGNAVEVIFENTSSSLINCFWVDFNGDEELNSSIEPGQTLTVSTYFGNAWLIRDESGNVVVYYYATGADIQNVPVSDEAIERAHMP